jgi:endonuclease III
VAETNLEELIQSTGITEKKAASLITAAREMMSGQGGAEGAGTQAEITAETKE